MPLDWKHYPQEASCYLAVRASNGNLCMEGMEDAIRTFDEIITEFNADGIIESKHLPMYLESHIADNGTGEQLTGLFHMWNAVEKDYPIKETPHNEFELGDTVVHKESGLHLTITTKIYYSVRMQWHYLALPVGTLNIDRADSTETYPEDVLWTSEYFYHLIHRFNVATVEIWKWDAKTGRIIKEGSPHKKMTPQDLIRQLQHIEGGKEVPF